MLGTQNSEEEEWVKINSDGTENTSHEPWILLGRRDRKVAAFVEETGANDAGTDSAAARRRIAPRNRHGPAASRRLRPTWPLLPRSAAARAVQRRGNGRVVRPAGLPRRRSAASASSSPPAGRGTRRACASSCLVSRARDALCRRTPPVDIDACAR